MTPTCIQNADEYMNISVCVTMAIFLYNGEDVLGLSEGESSEPSDGEPSLSVGVGPRSSPEVASFRFMFI